MSDALSKQRLSKLMSQKGLCSRREADELIRRGLVWVDGQQVSEVGIKVDSHCEITLSRQAKDHLAQQVTVLLNKPVGYVSSQAEDGYIPAIRLITSQNQVSKDKMRLKPLHLKGLAVAGRLDIDSQGLLVFTQNGRLAKELIGANSSVEKEYLVRVRGQLSQENLHLLRFGLELDGKPLKRAKVEWVNKDQLQFILKEGRKRQIRRMCEAVGLEVLGLKRVRIGRVKLESLPEGQWRFLKPNEHF